MGCERDDVGWDVKGTMSDGDVKGTMSDGDVTGTCTGTDVSCASLSSFSLYVPAPVDARIFTKGCVHVCEQRLRCSACSVGMQFLHECMCSCIWGVRI